MFKKYCSILFAIVAISLFSFNVFAANDSNTGVNYWWYHYAAPFISMVLIAATVYQCYKEPYHKVVIIPLLIAVLVLIWYVV